MLKNWSNNAAGKGTTEYLHTTTWRAFRKQQKHTSLNVFSGFCLLFPLATEGLKLSPGLQLDCPAGLLPGLQLNMLSLYCSPIEKNKTTTTKTVAESNMSNHYKDKARPNTRKAAKPFKLTYQNMVINNVIYNRSVNWLKDLVVSIKATSFKTNPGKKTKTGTNNRNVTEVLS